MTAGYSGKSLCEKLGINAGSVVVTFRAPETYRQLLEPLPQSVRFISKVGPSVDIVHIFATREAELSGQLAALRTTIQASAAVWVSWPKKASKIPSEITEDVVRAIALPLGFVDVKVCAVTDVWSGLKLVIRKSLRA